MENDVGFIKNKIENRYKLQLKNDHEKFIKINNNIYILESFQEGNYTLQESDNGSPDRHPDGSESYGGRYRYKTTKHDIDIWYFNYILNNIHHLNPYIYTVRSLDDSRIEILTGYQVGKIIRNFEKIIESNPARIILKRLSKEPSS